MKEYTGTENFGPSHYDFDYDFEIDLTFSVFDYILLGCYAIFVFPFVLLGLMFTRVLQRYERIKPTENKPVLHSSTENDSTAAPCCAWPRTSHS